MQSSYTTRVWLCTYDRRLRSGKRSVIRLLRWRGPDGKLRAQSLGPKSRMTNAEAREARRRKELELAQDAGATYAGKRVRLSELVEAYRRGGRTADVAARHALAAVGDLHAQQLTPQHASTYRIHLRERARKASGQPLSEATVIKHLRTMRAMWNWARRQGFVTFGQNPFSADPIGNPDEREPRILSDSEVASIERVLEGRAERDFRGGRELWQWWLVFTRLALGTGLRRAELLQLRWEDVDFDRGYAHVRPHKAPIPWRPKTRGSARSVPIDAETVADLRAFRLKRQDWEYVLLSPARAAQVSRRVAAGDGDAARYPVNNLKRQWDSIQREAGVDEPLATIHDLRKTYLTNVAREHPMHVVRELAGHSSIATTAKFYLKVTEDDANRVRKHLAERRRASAM